MTPEQLHQMAELQERVTEQAAEIGRLRVKYESQPEPTLSVLHVGGDCFEVPTEVVDEIKRQAAEIARLRTALEAWLEFDVRILHWPLLYSLGDAARDLVIKARRLTEEALK